MEIIHQLFVYISVNLFVLFRSARGLRTKLDPQLGAGRPEGWPGENAKCFHPLNTRRVGKAASRMFHFRLKDFQSLSHLWAISPANREENSNVGIWVMMPFEKGSLIQQQLKLSECFEVIQQPFFICRESNQRRFKLAIVSRHSNMSWVFRSFRDKNASQRKCFNWKSLSLRVCWLSDVT